MIKLTLWGASGQMGTAIKALLHQKPYNQSFTLSGEITSTTPSTTAQQLLNASDLVIDFSNSQGNAALLTELNHLKHKTSPLAVLIGSTGLSAEQCQQAENVCNKSSSPSLTMLIAPNTSLGIFVLYQTLKQLSGLLMETNEMDIEITEAHHRRKRDLPSGTAKLLFSAIQSQSAKPLHHGQHSHGQTRKKDYVGMHALRGGGIYGEHSVHFISEDEDICLQHRALSRGLFAKGALYLGKKLTTLPAGFHHYQDLSLTDLSPSNDS
ncbi:MAG: 4-hydroxy-tetrahydrodipicolinate reductase [Proteobacteria bacterium]|nr:4-hydroxy-tetrahydrodipicolinate reductase [Pseudomonadota bacterium]